MNGLLREVRACRLCAADLPSGPRPILQCAPSARILIASQAPGRLAHGSGIPFDDPSGERLRAWLGIERAEFYNARSIAILPMGFCYPGTGKSGDLPPRPECEPAWRARLLAMMPGIELTLVLGRYALAWHLPDPPSTLTASVKRWRDYWPAVVPLPHPSPRNNPWLRQNPWFEAELLPELRHRVRQLLSGNTDE